MRSSSASWRGISERGSFLDSGTFALVNSILAALPRSARCGQRGPVDDHGGHRRIDGRLR